MVSNNHKDKYRNKNDPYKTIEVNRAIAGECGAIEAIVNVLKTYSNKPGVCIQGCKALENIIADNSKYHLKSKLN